MGNEMYFIQYFTTIYQKLPNKLQEIHNISQHSSPGSAGCEASDSEAGYCSGGSCSAGDSDSD